MERRRFLKTSARAALLASAGKLTAHITQGNARTRPETAQGEYQVAVYYFPNYHVDPRNEAVHGRNWTEWELVRRGEPKFPGHHQPKVPSWGYEDESDPAVFANKIDAAADHGIDSFIFDWYWYDDGPFLNRGLEKGYLRAPNNEKLKFSLMWANHTWIDIHPAKSNIPPHVLYPGEVTRDTFERIMDYVIEFYFKHPSYWKINGCPYFSIYELHRFIKSMGSLFRAKLALDAFRGKVKKAGFPDLHLNAVLFGVQILPGEETMKNPEQQLEFLGIDSVTSYVWVHHATMPEFPATDYRYMAQAAEEHWYRTGRESRLPFFPNVTMGWDSSPRTCQSDIFSNAGYPFTPILVNNTPEAFRESLIAVRKFMDSQTGGKKICNINAWNEWTEGSYLEPDMVNGMGYLEAIKEVFG